MSFITSFSAIITLAALLSVNAANAQALYGTVVAPATATAATFNALDADVRFVQVGIRDTFFEPQNLVIAPGSTVVWINRSTRDHTVTSDDGSFRSGLLQPGATYAHVFNTLGTYTYYTQNGGGPGGQGMFGVVVVMRSDGAAAPEGQVLGTATDVPNLPNTGAGGMGIVNMVLLILSCIVAAAGVLVLRERARRQRQSRPFFFA